MTTDELVRLIQENGLEHYGLFYSSYEATVEDNQDPEDRGRLKVKCPSIYEDTVSDWALSKGMFAGKKIGFIALPQKGDPVWLSFRRGDPKYPIWEYGWFPEKYLPDNADHLHFIYITPKGYTLIFDEKDEQIILKKSDKEYIRIKEKVSIVANGENLFTQLNKLLETLLKLQNIQTIQGPGQFNPDAILALNQTKEAINKLLE